MKKNFLLAAFTVIGFGVLFNISGVRADDLCSMTTSSGKVVDLGSLCGSTGSSPVTKPVTKPAPSQSVAPKKFTGKCPVISAELVYSKIQPNNEECYYVNIADVITVGKAGDNIFIVPVVKKVVEVSSTSAFSTGYDIYQVDCNSQRYSLVRRQKTDDRDRIIEDLKLANGWVILSGRASPEFGMYSYACKLAI